MNPIGIMQGRLSPPVAGRIQSFPVDLWREEFSLAREAGLACIEWIYEKRTELENPLRTDIGLIEMRRLARRSGVGIWSVCADYYMEERLLTEQGQWRQPVVDHLRWLIERAGVLECKTIVLPFVDASSLKTRTHLQGLRAVLEQLLPRAQACQVELHLETDLSPVTLRTFLDEVGHPNVRANLDTGNSASLGHDPREELECLGPWLGSVHIKDRVLGGGTVPLGTGDTDFDAYFEGFQALSYEGPFILQVARSESVSEVEWARGNKAFVEAGWQRAGQRVGGLV